ncbi:MAG TPA: DUF2007 domain-containing protein [Bacteroidales bacterium]|nr:DUF2007 domain-containing protein [Bacteroidales bacterium]
MTRFSDERSPVVIFAGNVWEAGLVKSLLANAGIESFLNDEIRGTYAPWHVAPGGSGAVKIVVAKADVAKAGKIVEDFRQNSSSE